MPSISLPPRGIWVPTWLLAATGPDGKPLPPTVRDTWVMLKSLAAGQDALSATFDDLADLTGKHRSQLMSHLALLRDRCGLRFHTAGSLLLQVTTFGDGGPSGNPDSEIRKSGRAKILNELDFKPFSGGPSGNPDSTVKGLTFSVPKKKKEPPEGAIRKSGQTGNPDDLSLRSIPNGEELERQLALAYSSRGRRPPAAFKTVQQREAFEKVARVLNGEFEGLVKTAIARDRYALASLLAFLEACVKNRAKPAPVPAGNGPWRRGGT